MDGHPDRVAPLRRERPSACGWPRGRGARTVCATSACCPRGRHARPPGRNGRTPTWWPRSAREASASRGATRRPQPRPRAAASTWSSPPEPRPASRWPTSSGPHRDPRRRGARGDAAPPRSTSPPPRRSPRTSWPRCRTLELGVRVDHPRRRPLAASEREWTRDHARVRPHQPRHAPPLAAARPRPLGVLPAALALRRRRRVPQLPRRLRRPRRPGAAPAAAGLRPLRRRPDLRARLGDRRRPGRHAAPAHRARRDARSADDASPRGEVALALWEPPLHRTPARTARPYAGPRRRDRRPAGRPGQRGRAHPGLRPVAARRRAGGDDRGRPARRGRPVAAAAGGRVPRRLPPRGAPGDRAGAARAASCSAWPPPTRWSWASTSPASTPCSWRASPAPAPRCGSRSAAPGATPATRSRVLVARDDPLDTYLVTHPEALLDQAVEADRLRPREPLRPRPAPVRRRPGGAAARGRAGLFGPRRARPARPAHRRGACSGAGRTGWYWTHRRAGATRPHRHPLGRWPRRSRWSRARTGRVVGTVDGVERTRDRARRRRLRAPGRDLAGRVARPRRQRRDDRPRRGGLLHDGPRAHRHHRRRELEHRRWGEARISLGHRRRLPPGRVVPASPAAVRRGDRRGAARPAGADPRAPRPSGGRSPTTCWPRAASSPPTCPGAAHAAEHCSIGLLPLFATCDRWDIGGVSTAHHADTGRLTVFVYDGHPGGAGFAARGFTAASAWLTATRETIGRCALPRRLPVVRPVAEVRQPEQPTRQAGRRTAAGRPSRRRSGRVASPTWSSSACCSSPQALLAVAAALLSSSGTATFLGADLTAATIFLLGVGAVWPSCGATRSPSWAPAAPAASGVRTDSSASRTRATPQPSATRAGDGPAPLLSHPGPARASGREVGGLTQPVRPRRHDA